MAAARTCWSPGQGTFGGYVIPLAQERGWRVTGLARAEDEAFVRGLGANFATDHSPGWDAVVDTAVLQDQAVAMVRDCGTYVGVQPGNGPAEERGITVRVVVAAHDGARLAPLPDATAAGRLPARVHAVVPLEQVAEVPPRGGEGWRAREVRVAALTPT